MSTDQMEAGYPGKMMTTRGLPSPLRYKYCNIWIDHAKFIFPMFHITKEASEMLISKKCFEDFAQCFGVQMRNIRAGNGVYAAASFQQACSLRSDMLVHFITLLYGVTPGSLHTGCSQVKKPPGG